jgi:hypothetical protein
MNLPAGPPASRRPGFCAARERGATEEGLHPIAAAIVESCFTDWSIRCDGLQEYFTDVLPLDIQFWKR